MNIKERFKKLFTFRSIAISLAIDYLLSLTIVCILGITVFNQGLTIDELGNGYKFLLILGGFTLWCALFESVYILVLCFIDMIHK